MTKYPLIDPLQLARAQHRYMIELRRDFHKNPEIGFDLERTASIVSEELKKCNLSVKTGIAKTGVVADLKGHNASKTLAFRADMDGLPIQELNDVPYKSIIEKKAHLCGHDGHMAMLLGAIKILSQFSEKFSEKLPVNIRCIFQPSEEVWPGGASLMIKEGVLENVDEIYAFHVWPTLPVGHFGICLGPAMAQADGFSLTITGRGAHAAAPFSAIDPIVQASQIIQAFQMIVSQNIKSSDEAVVTVTQVHGGTCNNAISETCTLSGTVRTFDKKVQKKIRSRMEEICHGITLAHGGTCDFQYFEGYPVTKNWDTVAAKAKNIASKLVDEEHVHFPAKNALFGEDFAYFTEKIPGCFIQLGCQNDAKNINRMLHDPRFDIDEECLVYGAAFYVQCALGTL